jgi:exopolysaccharide production repressor protein
MTLPKFVLGMILVIAAVAIWSAFDSASAGMVLLRAVICAVVLQIGYFLYVLASVALQSRKAPNAQGDAARDVPEGTRAAEAKDLSVGRPLSH